MKRLIITVATLALCGSVAFSQSLLDAYRFGQTEQNGTARYMSMGGAFGALGGDISSLRSNPAGIAVYKSSEAVTTFSITSTNAKTDWQGAKENNSRTKFNFDNIAYVGYFPTGRSSGLVSWNAGFSYSRLKNFNRHYYMRSGGELPSSISDYIAERAYGIPHSILHNDEDAYRKTDWLPILGYDAGYIEYDKTDGEGKDVYKSMFGDRQAYDMDEARMNVRESGAIDSYNLSFGLNFSDRFLFGATFSVTDISYELMSNYEEWFAVDGNDLYLQNILSSDGSGYSVNAGVIVRPLDFLRVGVAYQSPTWYKMTDIYLGEAASTLTNSEYHESFKEAATPDGAYTDYDLRTPDIWLFSIAGIIGRYGLISFDYERTNYSNMHVKDHTGAPNTQTNDAISMNFKAGNTFRVGAEYKVTPQFAIRAGGAWSSSPLEADFKRGDMIEVMTVGTVPHYTLDKGSSSYSVGLGYRFTPQFYMDAACVLTTYKEDVFPYSNIFHNNDFLVQAIPATMKSERTQVSLTLGYKF